jgi:hypothetical protein
VGGWQTPFKSDKGEKYFPRRTICKAQSTASLSAAPEEKELNNHKFPFLHETSEELKQVL